MSCFIVSDLHVDLLVDVAFHGPSDSGKAWGPRLQWTAAHWQGSFPRASYKLEPGAADSEAPVCCNYDTLGALLVRANRDGYQARYTHTSETVIVWDYTGSSPRESYVDRITFEVDRYRHTSRPYRLSTVEALKAVACMRYQSCDTSAGMPDFGDTVAGRFLAALEATLLHVLPGMEAAPWEWRELPASFEAVPVDIFAL